MMKSLNKPEAMASYQSSPNLSPGYTFSSAEPSPSFFSPASAPEEFKSTPLLPTRNLEKRGRYHWIWELMCLFVSLGAIVGTIALLFHFDGKPIPEWSFRSSGISINTILSVLSTLSRSSLLIPLDEALGQLMWIGFAEGEKRLVEAEIFGRAAQGPWGAARLLWRKRGRGLASIGCLIMFLSVGIGLAQQQLISYPTREFESADPHNQIKVATMAGTYDSYQLTAPGGPNGPTQPALDFPVSASLYSALSRLERQAPQFNCEVGDCNFPEFTTIGVCASCKDNTTDVKSSCSGGVCQAQFGELSAVCYNSTSSSQYSTIVNQTTAEKSTALNATDPGVMTEVFTLQSDLSKWPPTHSASTCQLNWCLKTVKARVANATYSETIALTSSNGSVLDNGTIILTHGDDLNFRVTRNAQAAFRTLTSLFTGWSKTAGNGARVHSSDLFSGFAGFSTAHVNDFGVGDLNGTDSNPFKSIASSMSNAIRLDLTVSGSRVETKTIIKVRRWWIAYPVALWILSGVFLFSTMYRARRTEDLVGAWGSSNLALLLWGVDHRVRASVGDWSGAEMEKKASTVKAKLVNEGDGWRLRAVRGSGLKGAV